MSQASHHGSSNPLRLIGFSLARWLDQSVPPARNITKVMITITILVIMKEMISNILIVIISHGDYHLQLILNIYIFQQLRSLVPMRAMLVQSLKQPHALAESPAWSRRNPCGRTQRPSEIQSHMPLFAQVCDNPGGEIGHLQRIRLKHD